jgi:hypothetical protein
LGVALYATTACGDDDETHPGAGAGGAPAGASGEGGEGGEEVRAGSGGVTGGSGGTSQASAGEGGRGEAGGSGGGAGGAAGEAGADGFGGDPAGGAGAGGAPPDECAVGRSRRATFDETGGSLELCGAVLVLAPDVLEEERSVTLSIVALPAGAPEALEAGGLAFEVEVEGELPETASAPLSLVVPHFETSRYVYLYQHASGMWNYIEACTRESDHIGQEVWSEGVFVALVETEDFPTSVTGLGSGSVAVDFDGSESTFDLDADTIETYAIYDRTDGARSVTLSATKEASDSSLERLRIDFSIDDDGAATLIQITYGSTADVNGFWSYLPFFPQSAVVELIQDDDGELTGSVTTELTQGEVLRPFSADFDVVVERYRYPPEGYCNLPEGDAN